MERNDDEYKPRDYTIERWMVLLLSLLFLLPFVAQAQETTTLADNEGAALLLKTTKPGTYQRLAAVKSEVHIAVTGPIVRTTVTQTFHNTTGRCVEGVYVYPLPEMSAVDTLKMTVGSRVIVGEIRQREAARQEYEQAKAEGRKAALVEQERPNVFETSVASLMPDEDAIVEIAYQETARFEGGEYRLRFPMAVAERYRPATSTTSAKLPPVPRAANSATVTMSVDLETGYSVASFRGSLPIVTQSVGHRRYHVDVDGAAAASGRDFELAWQPDLGTTPEATVLAENQAGGSTYALVMVTPPAHAAARLPRESIFIIDSSGSMEGASMEQAKAALRLALDDLRPSDRFNVIDFDSLARPLFDSSRAASPDNIRAANAFIDGITADGGTEMLAALKLALVQSSAPAGVVRQVVFMTDGQVENEQELFSFIHDHLGDTRLFTVGIGAAPNSHFMRNAARFGRGTFTYIGDVQQVQQRMSELFAKIDAPLMTDIEVRSSDAAAESWPDRVPDLYRGEPLVVALRLQDADATITLRGHLGGEPWTTRLTLPHGSNDSGIGKLWGREKIESLMDHLTGGGDPKQIEAEVTKVALDQHLVSQYTSLVAVDRSPAGLAPSCRAELLPVANGGDAQPEGTLPQTATPAALLLIAGAFMAAAAIVILRVAR